MGGIAGWIEFSIDLNGLQAVVEAMTATMATRGPDFGGIWVNRHAALGCRGLSLGNHVGGSQPAVEHTPNGAVVVTYSGELYDVEQLRRELISRGHVFRSRGDSEVVLRGYLEWGDEVAERLVGMYSFAIWDGRKRELVLVRDRLGVKPLYVHRTRDGVLFGSEPKAMLMNPVFRRRVDVHGLRELVGFTKAPRWALWRDLREVEPGKVLVVGEQGARERTYWRLETAPHHGDVEESTNAIRGLLTAAVNGQAIADAPVRTLLSGGLGSGAVTALAAQAVSSDTGKLVTFSVDVMGHQPNTVSGEWRASDSGFALPAEVEHRSVVLTSRVLVDPEVRRAVVSAWDMPVGGGGTDASLYLLARGIRAEGMVLLSPELGDELFGGPRSHSASAAGRFPWLELHDSHTCGQATPLRPEVRAALDVPAYIQSEYAAAVARVEHLDGDDDVQRRARVLKHLNITRLARNGFDRADRMSMATGLQARMPFADHRLVEYAYNVPRSLMAGQGGDAELLRRAVAPLLPQPVSARMNRPKPSNQDADYSRALREQASELLASRSSPVFDVFDRDWLARVVHGGMCDMTAEVREGLERILNFNHWVELYRPELDLA
jgi:asparagine synthase (glutamine-hydrolysing)